MNITQQICKRMLELQNCKISANVLEQARACLLDFTGVCIAGTKILEKWNQNYLKKVGISETGYTVIGMKAKADVYTAVLLNGCNAHGAELDDGHRFGMIHLGAVICPGLIAVTEKEKISSEYFFRGMIAGYEVAVALSKLMQPEHKMRGYHTTGTCGTVGAALAIAVAREYDETQISATLAAAVTSAGGILEIQEDGSDLKPFNAGQAALSGLVAANIGCCGCVGPKDPIGGKRGMLKVMSNWENQEIIWPEKYYIETIYRKPYAACRHSHSAIEAADFLKKKFQINLDEVSEIWIETYKAAVFGHSHQKIQSISSAKMSTPYAVAVALIFGNAGLNSFSEENIFNDQIYQLLSKISVRENDKLSEAAPQKRAAIVTICMKNGKKYSHQVDYPKGEPENKMNDMELNVKFSDMCAYVGVNEETISCIKESIKNF